MGSAHPEIILVAFFGRRIQHMRLWEIRNVLGSPTQSKDFELTTPKQGQ
jgi:hypothetical protein